MPTSAVGPTRLKQFFMRLVWELYMSSFDDIYFMGPFVWITINVFVFLAAYMMWGTTSELFLSISSIILVLMIWVVVSVWWMFLVKKGAGCLFSGSRYFSFNPSAAVKMDFVCILCAGRWLSK